MGSSRNVTERNPVSLVPGRSRARHNPNHSALARQKIRASALVRRLQLNGMGKLDPPLTLSQVRSIEILLRKIVPDLVQTNITGEVQHKYVAEVPPLLTKDEWQKKYQITHQHPPTLELKAEKTMPLITSNLPE